MKLRIVTLLVLAALLLVPTGQAQAGRKVLDPDRLYQPDLAAVVFESEAEANPAGPVNVLGLTEWTPFNADMVDTDQVSNTGQGVYVAVLDTGLVSNWDYFFPSATIRDDLGKGFTHDITCDASGNLLVGPLRDDRGFITDPYLSSGHGTHVTRTIVGYYECRTLK